MNMPRLPVLDPRTPAEVADEVRRQLGWPDTPRDDLREALIAVFARFAERLGQRLNAAPQRQLEAFAGLLNPTPYEARPASTVLLFQPVARQDRVQVPAGTQVAGPPPAGATEPIVFETQADLVLRNAELGRAFTASGAAWSPWADVGAKSAQAGDGRTQPLPEVYAFALPAAVITPVPAELRLELAVQPGNGARSDWFLLTEQGEQTVQPAADGTTGLTQDGELVFRGLPVPAPTLLQGRSGRWLCVRTGGAVITRVRFSARHELAAHRPEAGLSGAAPLDLSRDFAPLGPRPQFGDVFVLQDPAFALPGAEVTLALTLTNPSEGSIATPIPRVAVDHSPALQWDAWTARGWVPLTPLKEGTAGLSRSGALQLALPADALPVQSRAGAVRARLSQGDYVVSVKPDSARDAMPWQPPEHRPPYIAQITVAAVARSPACAPEAVLLQRGLETRTLAVGADGAVAALPAADETAALYLGLRWPPDSTPSGPVQWVLAHATRGPKAIGDADEAPAHEPPVCHYRTAHGWAAARVELLPCELPGRLSLRVHVGEGWERWANSRVDPALHWLRLVDPQDPQALPPWDGLRMNAVPATEQLTLVDEVLGSSDGSPGQQFDLARGRVLAGAALEVGEPGPLASTDLRDLLEAGHALRLEPALGHLPEVAWVRWQRVPDFSASGPQSRVYVLDAERGRVRFGDGRQGRIPPAGPNRVRMAHYRSGGSAAGNCPPGTLKQLRSSLRGIESVSQPERARGGHDGETAASSTVAATAWLRHRDRAVGPDDFQDLACRATPAVARARCLPARDLAADALGQAPAPGCISLALLPREAGEAAPLPSVEMMAEVRAFLRTRCDPEARLVLAAPVYVRIDVDLEVRAAATADGATLVAACDGRLTAFLHPVTGGADGQGWPFGRWPHVSELRAALAGLPGLVEVRRLQRRLAEPQPGTAAAAHALLCAGQCRITVVS